MVLPVHSKRDIAVSVPDRWGDTIVFCWHTRYDVELLRESTALPLRVTPNISKIVDDRFSVETCYNWKVRHKKKSIEPNTEDIPQDLIVANKRFIEWLDGLQTMKSMINGLRKIRDPSPMWQDQDWIYHEKVAEAQKVLTGTGRADLVFLPIEAEQRKVTLYDLAEQVMIMHNIDLAYLAKTEALRIRWLGSYRRLADDTSVDISNFLTEMKKEIYDHQEI